MAKITVSPREYVVTLNENEFRFITSLLGDTSYEDANKYHVPPKLLSDLYGNFANAE